MVTPLPIIVGNEAVVSSNGKEQRGVNSAWVIAHYGGTRQNVSNHARTHQWPVVHTRGNEKFYAIESVVKTMDSRDISRNIHNPLYAEFQRVRCKMREIRTDLGSSYHVKLLVELVNGGWLEARRTNLPRKRDVFLHRANGEKVQARYYDFRKLEKAGLVGELGHTRKYDGYVATRDGQKLVEGLVKQTNGKLDNS